MGLIKSFLCNEPWFIKLFFQRRTKIRILSVQAAGIASGFNVVGADRGGSYQLAAYGVVPLSGSGSLLSITVEALEQGGRRPTLTITGVANEGGIPLRVRGRAQDSGKGIER